MNISHNVWKCNKGNTFVVEGISESILRNQEVSQINQPQYLSPDYFLPASQSKSYYSKKYIGNQTAGITQGIRPSYQSKRSKIARVASIMLLSLGFLATAIEVEASPSLDFGTSAPYVSRSPKQLKKKPLLKRAGHKVAKRLGFSSSPSNTHTETSRDTRTASSQGYKVPEITLEELKELYANEYGETMDATTEGFGAAETLKRSLALREKELGARRADRSFAAARAADSSREEEPIYSKPLDAISISSSTTEYSEPWQDPDDEIARVLGSEFTSNNQIEPMAPPLPAFFTVSAGGGEGDRGSNISSQFSHAQGGMEIGGIKINNNLLETAYNDNIVKEETEGIGSIDRDESEWAISESELNAELHEQIEELKRRGLYKESEVVGDHEAKFPDARYEKVSGAEEAKQTMSRIPSKVSEMRAIMEEKYATIAGAHVLQSRQQAPQEVSTASNGINNEVGAGNKEIPVFRETKEKKELEVLDISIEDSGYSSPSGCSDGSGSASRTSSPAIDSRAGSPIEAQVIEFKAIDGVSKDGELEQNTTLLHTGKPLDSAVLNDELASDGNYSSTSTSSYEYDTDVDIRTYENVPKNSRKKHLKTRRQRREALRYSERDIEEGLAELNDDSEFSELEGEEWNDKDSIAGTEGYDTVYTSSSSEYPDSGDEYESIVNVRQDNIEDIGNINIGDEDLPLPPPPTEEELEELARSSKLNTFTEGSNTDQPIDEAKQSLEVGDQVLSLTSSDDTNFVSIAVNSKESEEALQEASQEERGQLSSLEILDQESEEESIKDPITEASASTFSEPEAQAASMSKEELLKKVTAVAVMHNQVREACHVAGKQIRHRIFVRDTLTSAVAAGDEEQGNIAGYHLWSSGTLGIAKQKAQTISNGYSGRMLGGSIGADIHLENDLLLGASFSKIRSSIKHPIQGSYNDLRHQHRKTKTNYSTYIFSLYGSGSVSPNMSIGVIGSSGVSKASRSKARSKLFSFEPHLHYKILLPKEVALIPHIGFRYEYEKTGSYKEQVTREHTIERGKKSHKVFNTEIGSRVIFAPVRLANSLESALASSFAITPTAHFSVERRIGSKGKSQPFTLSYQEMEREVSTSTLSINPQYSKTSLNGGIGIIVSRKNIKLELLYAQERQKRFKSHQGVLKLKVSL